MGAARYIGRIGGLAVALGIGTAIVTGQGVAYATPTEGDTQGGTQTGSDTGDTTGTTPDTGAGAVATIDDKKPPRLSDIFGRHRATDTTPSSVTATSIVKRLSDAAETTVKRVTDALQNAAGAVDPADSAKTTTPRSVGSVTDRHAARAERVIERITPPAVADDGDDQTAGAVATDVIGRASVVKDWLASPPVAAGRAVTAPAPAPTISSLWTPPSLPTTPTATVTAGPNPSATNRAPNLLTTVFANVLSPFAGDAPGAPIPESPASWIALGASRRQIGVESFTSEALVSPANSIVYNPSVTLYQGVITGVNAAPTSVNGNPLTYTVVGDPSGGGKVLIDPTTGSFSFLPDFSSVQDPNSTETFKVLVAETTPFDAALMQIPILGTFVPQVLVILHQVPIVNVVLAPLIGQSAVVPVTVEVGELVYDGTTTAKPVAFTVMVPSPVDGALISTNFFPALSVVADPTTTAPTILNGPGLATAGNTDPSSTSIVDGLVPGLQPLREAGYNVVTWDPRGEFASGGRLQLDSPEYEAQDVGGIIDWISDPANTPYTRIAFDSGANLPDEDYADNDPAIGMVGGSYGGGIQLVTAAVDPRIDVIVPVIAWNSLDDSLYTNDAFKTSYASLLLLALVTTGARINPQIYAGIITGAVLGILTPSQQALLARSGPKGFADQITVPTLFIQGTIDVLFPLQQSLDNAEQIGTPVDEIQMIWACGGHGVCLTMTPDEIAAQDYMLQQYTLNWLDHTLKGEPLPADSRTFQFVDQNSQWYYSDLLPIEEGFYDDSPVIGAAGANGGLIAIVPVVGGSGPQSLAGFPASLGLGSEASKAINVPLEDGAVGETVVGAPHVTFDYSGVGTSRHVYAQVVDKNTGLVVGNIVTPIPVTLDGKTHTADIDLEDIVYTYDTVPDDADLELQIVGSATAYENFTQYGYIHVTNVSVSLPTPGDGVIHTETLPAPPTVAAV